MGGRFKQCHHAVLNRDDQNDFTSVREAKERRTSQTGQYRYTTDRINDAQKIGNIGVVLKSVQDVQAFPILVYF